MIVKIFNGDYLKRLDNIIQWSEMDVNTHESVSSHSYKVTIFCRVLLEEIFDKEWNRKVSNFVLSCVDHAMFHDWDEALLLRDISHETKYNDFNGDEIRKALDALSEHLSRVEFNADTIGGKFVYSALNTKDENVKTFCKLCDWMALAFFIKREQSRGNKCLRKQYLTVRNGLYSSVKKCKEMFSREFKEEADTFILDVLFEQMYINE